MTVAHCNTDERQRKQIRNQQWPLLCLFFQTKTTKASVWWMNTCENMCKCISSCDLQGGVLGSKHVQEESSQAAQDAQETEGGDHPHQQDGLRVHTVIWRTKRHHKAFKRCPQRSLCQRCNALVLDLTVQQLGVNVPQDVRHPQLLSLTSAPVDPEPGRLRQSRTQRGDGQSSRQSRHQAPLRLLGQGGAPSSPPASRNSWTRRGIHAHPISLLQCPIPFYWQKKRLYYSTRW